eukprot:CAMPEP_0195287896 /NCGR_PEP_ID=MMETSP0707-20130614/4778_1 /TAXON_ID=33640 /ORGANISM="Asterionellopsis glacialis, Strain CCMP134" /LENGTH=149 /DNA_ID=CAMNT_0040347701 /DNA_START=31 /DNA_END=480 /DNA_ORIENTATION=+
MSSMQSKAKELNARMEGAATSMMDDLDRRTIRPLAHQSYKCVVQCFDKAGSKESSQFLSHCSQQCQMPYQQANQILQTEFHQFQQRLNRSMQTCQDQARDQLVPGQEQNAKAMAKVEQALLKCMSKTVEEHIQLLPSTKERIIGMVKNL